MDVTGIILGVIGIIIGSGITGFIALKKLPTEQRIAEINLAAKVREIYDEMNNDLKARVAEQGEMLAKQGERIEQLSKELDVAKARIKVLEDENDRLVRENKRLKAGAV